MQENTEYSKLTFEDLPKVVATLVSELESLKRLMLQNSSSQNQQSSEVLFTVNQAAEYLSLAIPTVYSLTSRREIPFMKRGKRVYFKKADLEKYVFDGRIKSRAEIQDEAIQCLKMRKSK